MAAGAAACTMLVACDGGGGREETVTENLADTMAVEAGGAAEAGRPADMNVTNTAPPAAAPANEVADGAPANNVAAAADNLSQPR
jgi:hypothetical protein